MNNKIRKGECVMAKVTLSFSYPEGIKKKLQILAAKDNRTLSWYITNILDKTVKKIITKRRK